MSDHAPSPAPSASITADPAAPFGRELGPMICGPFAPVLEESTLEGLEVIGEIPADLSGVYLRNGPNPRQRPNGRYHWFDGDGMLHAAHFDRGRLTYRNRWVRTDALRREEEAGRALHWGVLETQKDRGDRPMKDTANTDVIGHGGLAVASWYLCGDAWLLHPITLETLGKIEGIGGPRAKMSAHPKVDEATGELLFFDSWDEAPYLSYGVLGPDRELRHHVPIELPGPRLPHDMAVTEHYTILHDLPLFYDLEALAAGRHKLAFHPEMPARFGVIPRYGSPGEIRWFEASPCFIYHVVNAWEEGDEVVMVACRYQTPTDPAGRPDAARMAKMIALLQMDARVVRYRFDLRTGLTREEVIDPEHNLEFPSCNGARAGRRTRFAWLMEQTVERPHFTAVVRQDTDTGAWERWSDGPGVFYSEPAFAPREGAAAEDDGYLVTFAWDEGAQRSEIQVFDAREVRRGPVARAIVPRRIPAGFHATWIGEGRVAR